MPDASQIPVIGPLYNALTPEERDQIPIFGDVWRSMNAIVTFVEYGCYPHWTVWVQTLLPAFGTVVLQILDFGWSDILHGYFRPSSTRGLSGLTRKPSRRRPLKAGELARAERSFEIPEIGNEIGKALPGSKFFQARKVTGVEAFLWDVDFLVERGLWYWLVADIGADFIENWTSGIMKSEACQQEPYGYVHAHKTGPVLQANNGWAGFGLWTTDAADPPGIWDGQQMIVPGGHNYFATVTGRLTSDFGPTAQHVRLAVRGGSHDIESPYIIPPGESQNDITTAGSAQSVGTTIGPVGYAEGSGIYRWHDLVFSASVS